MRQHAPPRDHRTQKLENIAAQIYRRLLPNDLDKQVQQRVPEQVAHHVSRFRREGTLPSVMLGFLFSLSSPANLLLPAFLDCDGDNDDDSIRPTATRAASACDTTNNRIGRYRQTRMHNGANGIIQYEGDGRCGPRWQALHTQHHPIPGRRISLGPSVVLPTAEATN
jgi:hypothetical protein